MANKTILTILAALGLGGAAVWHSQKDAPVSAPAGEVAGGNQGGHGPDDFEKKKAELDPEYLRAGKNNIKTILVAESQFLQLQDMAAQMNFENALRVNTRLLNQFAIKAGYPGVTFGTDAGGRFRTDNNFMNQLILQCREELRQGIGVQGPTSLMPKQPPAQNPDVAKVEVPTFRIQVLLRAASSSISPDTKADAYKQLQSVEENMNRQGFETKLLMDSDTGIYSFKYRPTGSQQEYNVLDGTEPKGRAKSK